MRALEGKVILITGATDGLGRQVAIDFAKQGATLLVHGRSAERGKDLLRDLEESVADVEATFYQADFASLSQVRQLSARVREEQQRLDVLINNAGEGVGVPGEGRAESEDSFELRFAVNYLAPYTLTRGLLPLLRKSAPSRIVNVSSVGQQAIDFTDVMLKKNYSGVRAYSQSKLALIMFTIDLAEELKSSGVTVNALHPASLMPTKIVTGAGLGVMSTIEEGAQATENLAVSPELEGVTGKYFDQLNEAKAKPQAYDADAREKLRELAKRLSAPTAN